MTERLKVYRHFLRWVSGSVHNHLFNLSLLLVSVLLCLRVQRQPGLTTGKSSEVEEPVFCFIPKTSTVLTSSKAVLFECWFWSVKCQQHTRTWNNLGCHSFLLIIISGAELLSFHCGPNTSLLCAEKFLRSWFGFCNLSASSPLLCTPLFSCFSSLKS